SAAGYGKYSLTVGTESEDVWVTAQPMYFHWTGGDNALQNITIVQDGASSLDYWRWRGVKATAWVGGGSTYGYTDSQSYIDAWNYAKTYDGISVDEVYVNDAGADFAVAQAGGKLPQQ